MSDMKCPICGSKMSVSYGTGEGLFSCSNVACKASYFFATDDMWQELIKVMEENKRTRKALDVAVDALKYANKCIKGGCVNWETEIDRALEQIKTALEQKD